MKQVQRIAVKKLRTKLATVESYDANSGKINRSCFRKWIHFVAWIRSKEIITNIDVLKYSQSKWKISSDEKMLKITLSDGTVSYRSRQEKYKSDTIRDLNIISDRKLVDECARKEAQH